ncbi:Ppx/GppA phosphatase family protein [Amorphus orientalis]|uniref:Ppx/GppA phosphatase family protein n=1 Tax=Amorphus orientalis TaxID=649198 RepID=UPI0027D7E34A|nr:Ppx/GppA phosphatase family protein [Amorphus orientalis]
MDGMDDDADSAGWADAASAEPAVTRHGAEDSSACVQGRGLAAMAEPKRPARRDHPSGGGVNCASRSRSGAGRRLGRTPPPDGRYAALDLGTNNCRLLIAEPRGRGYRVIDAFSRIVRLGEGVSTNGTLGEAAMGRAMEALQVCARKLGQAGVLKSRLIATEACRMAENGPAFVSRVEEEVGLSLEIVSRETEARLAVAGCSNLIDRGAEGVVLFDIGGGSSEIVWLDLSGRHRLNGVAVTRCIRAWTSLPVGVVSLAERHGGVEVDAAKFEEMVEDVGCLLARLDHAGALDRVVSRGRVHLLGTSGTVTTLAGVHLGLERYDRRRVDGTWLDERDVDQMIERILAMPFAERVANPCIGADRADLVLAGCAILEAIRRRWPCRRLRVADRGLREGILMELMAQDRTAAARANGQPS